MIKKGFIRSRQEHFSTIYRLIDFLVIFGALLLSCRISHVTINNSVALLGVASGSVFMIAAESFELYRSWRTSSMKDIFSATTASWLVVIALLMALYFFYPATHIPRDTVVVWAGLVWISLCGWRFGFRKFLHRIRRKGFNSRTAAIIGVTETGIELAQNIVANLHHGIKLIGFFDDRASGRIDDNWRSSMLGTIDDAIHFAHSNEVDLLYVAMPLRAEERILEILERCADTTVNVHLVPNFYINRVLHARWHEVGAVNTLSIYDTPLNGLGSWLKRAEDVVLALLILLLVSIPMMLIAIVIKLTSDGPVLFRQDRYGLDGKKIKVRKFRTMRSMENDGNVRQATRGDPRITPFGAFLRKTSLDELPQFFNVLDGSMSIVGPRPHAVAHNELYRRQISGYMLRHKVKPGITGWAQINGWRGETDTLDKMEKRIEFDLAYITEWSLWLDIKIVFLTAIRGFTGSNAY